MKKLFLAFSIMAFGLVTNAQPPAGDAKPGEWYGEKITAEGAVPISDAVAKLNSGTEKWTQRSKQKLWKCVKRKVAG